MNLSTNLTDDAPVELVELDHRIEPVAELGGERLRNRFHRVRGVVLGREAHRPAVALLGPRIGRHHHRDVAEVGLAPVVVGEGAVVHDLEKDVEHVRVRLLDLVEKKHASGGAC